MLFFCTYHGYHDSYKRGAKYTLELRETGKWEAFLTNIRFHVYRRHNKRFTFVWEYKNFATFSQDWEILGIVDVE